MAKYFFNIYDEFKSKQSSLNLDFRGVIKTPYLTLQHKDSETRTAGDIMLTSDGLAFVRGGKTPDGLESGFVYSPNIMFDNEQTADGEIYARIRVLGQSSSPDNFTNNGPSFAFRRNGIDSYTSDYVYFATGGTNNYVSTFERINGERESRIPASTAWQAKPLRLHQYEYMNYRVRLEGKTWSFKNWVGDKGDEPENWNKTELDSKIINTNDGFISFFIPSNRLTAVISELGIGTNGDTAPKNTVENPPSKEQYLISGKVTLELAPHASKVVIVSADDEAQLIGVVDSDPITGIYECRTTYSQPVMIFTTQNYGDVWKESAAKVIGDVVHPTTPNGYVYKVTESGNTGQTEPAWTAEQNASINDGSVIYQAERLLEPEIEGYVTPKAIS